jgi:molecular chaperone GrpE
MAEHDEKNETQNGPNGSNGATEDALTPEQADEIVAAAREGQLEVPSGADDIVGALLLVAQQRDGHLDSLRRAAADLQNFQRRARIQAQEAREQAVRGVVTSLLMSLDTFDLAMQQDPATVNAEQVFAGIKAIKGEILRQLGMHGVTAVEPRPGDEFQPGMHEAVMHEPTGDVEAGSVARSLQTGYAMGERVIRPAKVSIAAAPVGGGGGDDSKPGADASETE